MRRSLLTSDTAPADTMTEHPIVELSLLRSFSPLDGLKNENLRALARKTTLRELAAGRLLFREGDQEKRTFYLVSKKVKAIIRLKTIPVTIENLGGWSRQLKAWGYKDVPEKYLGM